MTKDVVVEHGESSKAPLVAPVASGVGRAASVADVFLRFLAIVGTIASAIAMGTTNETLPFFTQFIQFEAKYSDLPSFTYVSRRRFTFTATATWKPFCSLAPLAASPTIKYFYRRFFVAANAVAMLALLTAGASAAAAIVYLAHKGNVRANWFAICQQFDSFCERISGSLIGSFAAMVLLIMLIFLSAFALARRH
ncbi:hypothetical protein C2845_PM15G10740 [Panicum miliaceum]|uniref:CASP-like protein n=1 Tax=Panicum miliaceum TaxID=4540 RepID=A0A3L6Q621_PANMI|nr:hypothetical protein C2845_PM15G10740 [Panicum miliaceum]